MKKNLYLYAVMFFLSFITATTAQAQMLSDKEKNALLTYWASDPKLSVFSAEAKQKVLSNVANVKALKPCAVAAQQVKVLKDAHLMFRSDKKMADMVYDKINANFQPDYTKKIFPRFNKREYLNSQDLDKKISGSDGGSPWHYVYVDFGANLQTDLTNNLLKAYTKKRNENFSKESAFTTLEFDHPEAISVLENKLKGKLYQGIKGATNLSNNSLMIEMLEYNHWENVSNFAFGHIITDMETAENSLSECNSITVALLNEVSGRLVNNVDLSKLAGDWEKDTELGVQHFGFPVEFYHVEINSITGRWGRFSTTKSGKITGGSYNERTKVLSFTYVQWVDSKKGTAELFLTETETEYKLRGTWKHDDGSGSGGLMMERLK